MIRNLGCYLLFYVLSNHAAIANACIALETKPEVYTRSHWVSCPLEKTSTSAQDILEVTSSDQPWPILGFGGALTDATLINLNRMMPAQRQKVIETLFNKAKGIHLNVIRVPIGATDFSTQRYTWDDLPSGQSDEELSHFQVDPLRLGLLDTLHEIRQVNPTVKIVLTPWSAPAWMKNNQSLIGGALLETEEDAYSRYLIQSIQSFTQQNIPVHAITVQNEPQFEPDDYPGMKIMAPQRTQFISQYLGPKLAHLTAQPQLWDWDHNWDNAQEPRADLADPLAKAFIDTIAWHCYAGNIQSQVDLQHEFTTMPSYLSECSTGDWTGGFSDSLFNVLDTLVIPELNQGAQGVMLWNLILDEHHGPHLGGCGNCRGLLTFSRKSRQLTFNADFIALSHFSLFLDDGATAMKLQWISSEQKRSHSQSKLNQKRLPVSAAVIDNSIRREWVMVFSNAGSIQRHIQIRMKALTVQVKVNARSVLTIVVPKEDRNDKRSA
jgi:glucosylceramidase